MAAIYSKNVCVICQVALDINCTAKGNEWLELLKCSKGLETVLEFFDLHDESEMSKYLSITYFILFIYSFYLLFVYILTPCANTSERSAGSGIWCLDPFMGF